MVLVDGAVSKAYELSNMVFQGTVLGPMLWNVFFADSRGAVQEAGADESKYADDMTATVQFNLAVPNVVVRSHLQRTQQLAHRWCSLSQVAFDLSKEEFRILHPVFGAGATFRFLGPWIDSKLVMDVAVRKVANKARPKRTALLRLRSFYSLPELVAQFKTHILPILEGGSGAICHASTTVLEPLVRVQSGFLNEIGVSHARAFLDFNLAPLGLRRGIGLAGLLWKCAWRVAHPEFLKLFTLRASSARTSGRLQPRPHARQLEDRCDGRRGAMMDRSIFGRVRVFTRLPARAVDAKSASQLQTQLTRIARDLCAREVVGWSTCFSPRRCLHEIVF